jgi:hypothetical protein
MELFDSGARGRILDTEDGRLIARLQRLTAELLADKRSGLHPVRMTPA